MPLSDDAPISPHPLSTGKLRVGIDLVKTSRIAESVERFGDRFLRRIYTTAELEYALSSGACRDERLAARFAAKEAAMKALRLAHRAVKWTDIEVMRSVDGIVWLRLHGSADAAVQADGISNIALSMSHEGDYATAIVVAGWD